MKKIPVLVTLIVSSFVAYGQVISYADEVLDFSSQFGTNNYSANQATGEPDLYPQHADNSRAWASSTADDMREYLELSYDCGFPINELWVYETFNPGAVDTVYVRNPSTGAWEMVWSGTATQEPPIARIFVASFEETTFGVNEIRLAINSPAVAGYNEIDAVAIVNTSDGLQPDLVVQNVAGLPEAVDPFEVFSFSFDVVNQGTFCADESNVSFFLSTDETLDFRDTEFREIEVDPIGSGQTFPFTAGVSFPEEIESGGYFVFAQADSSEDIEESDEENNVLLVGEITVNPAVVDLTISSFTLQETTLGPEDESELSFSITNQGSTLAGSSTLEVFISLDAELTLLDDNVFQATIEELEGDESVEIVGTMTVPLDYEPGNYQVISILDRGNELAETNEANNTASVVLEYVTSVDFSVENLVVNASPITQSDMLSFTYDLVNNGSSEFTSEVDMTFYLSLDEVIDTQDLVLGNVNTTLGADLERSFPVPDNFSTGNYQLIVRVDPSDNIFETDESNNETSASLEISQADVDLAIRNLSFEASEIQVGNSTTVTVEVENLGSALAFTTVFDTYLSTNDQLDASDLQLDRSSHATISGGSFTSEDVFLSFQDVDEAGTYFMIIDLDVTNLITESNEANNVSAFEITVIANDTDLTYQNAALSSNSLARGIGRLSVAGTIINNGSQMSNSFPVKMYLSRDEQLDQEDDQLYSSQVFGGQAGGASFPLEQDLVFNPLLSEGDYFILIDVAEDRPDAVPENNLIALPFSITASQVDLVPQNLTLSEETVSAGSSVNVTGEIANIGSQVSSSGRYGIYLSSDDQWDRQDILLRSSFHGDIDSESPLSLDLDATIPAQVSSGTYSILLVADQEFENPEISDNNVRDLNGGNNVLATAITIIDSTLDLFLENLSAPTEVQEGRRIAFSARIGISDGAELTENYINVFLSENETLDDADFLVKEIYLDGEEIEEDLPENDFVFDQEVLMPAFLEAGDYTLILQIDAREEVVEVNEMNNTISAPLTLLASTVDLVALELISSDDQVAPNSSFTLEYAFENRGQSTSGDGSYRIVLSDDEFPDAEDLELRERSFSEFEPSDFVLDERNFSIDIDQASGDYFLILDVDYVQTVPESDEDNNISILPITVSEADVDLIVSDFELAENVFSAGEGVLASVVSRNVGSTTSDRHAIAIYLSDDEVLDAEERVNLLFGSGGLSDLSPGEEASVGRVITVEEPGEYFLIAEVDYSKAIVETDESNNTVSLPIQVTEGRTGSGENPAGPILSFESVNLSATEVLQGRMLGITTTIRNEGGAGSSFTRVQYELYLDENGIDRVASIGSLNHTIPKPGASVTRKLEREVMVETGDYFLIATTADARFVQPLSVVAADVDLDVFNAFLPDGNVLTAGEQFNMTAQVVNNGTQNFRSGDRVNYGIYISQDDQLDSRDYLLEDRGEIRDLDPLESADLRSTLFFPTDQGIGNFYLIIKADEEDLVSETNKQNNVLATPIIVEANSVDLQLVNSSLNRTTTIAGGFVDFRTTIINRGNSFNGGFRIAFYVSGDSVLSAGDDLVAEERFDSIDPDDAFTIVQGLIMPSDLQLRNYHILARIDAENEIQETNEGNNISIGGIVTNTQVGSPDLFIENARVAPEAFKANAALLGVLGTLSNQGTATANPGSISIYVSEDEILDANDVVLERRGSPIFEVDPIVAGGSASFDQGYFLDAATAPGDYFVLIQADPEGLVEESDETNNIVAIPFTLAPLDFDYSAVSSSLSETSIAAGERVVSTLNLVNEGEDFAPGVYIEYFLSRDETIDAGDVSLLEVVENRSLSSAISERQEVLIIDTETTPGSYQILARLDSRFEGDEIDETNNDVIVGALEVTASDIDLLVTELLVETANPVAGGLVEIDYTVENAGNSSLTEASIAFYLSTDETLDASDVFVSQEFFQFVNAAMSINTAGLNISPSLSAGNYFIIGSVDDDALVTESDETNNTTSLSITLANPDIDIELQELSVNPSDVTNSQLVTFTGLVANTGTSPSSSFSIGIYASLDETFDATDNLLGEVEVADLGSNGINRLFSSEELSIRDLALGSYTIFYVVDEAEELLETDESNNVFEASELLTIGTDVDLIVNFVNLPSEVREGGEINFSATIGNTGALDSETTTLGIYLSTDSELDESDVLVIEEEVPAVSAEEEYVFTIALALPATVTSGSYQVIVQVDALEEEPELDESNNLFITTESLVVSPGADLIVEGFTIGDGPIRTGGTLLINGTVSNIGTIATSATALGLYLSTNDTFDAEDQLVAEVTIGEVTIEGSAVAEATADLSSVSAGEYQLLAVADHTELVIEFDEDNNIATSELITILPGQDLVVTSIADLPESIDVDETLEISGVVSNIGTSVSAATTVMIYLSSDEQLDEEDLLASQVELAAVPAEATSTFSAAVTFADLALSSYFVIVQADGLEAEAEFDETNNLLVSAASFELTETPLSVNVEREISVFPNPFTAYVIVNGVSIEEYQVFNYKGQRMNAQQVGINRIDLSQLASGVYILELITDDATKIRKKIVKKN